MSRYAFVFDLTGAMAPTYNRARSLLRDLGWEVDEQGSFYISPEDHGLIQCVEDLHSVVANERAFGACVRSAHLVEMTAENDVADLLQQMAEQMGQ